MEEEEDDHHHHIIVKEVVATPDLGQGQDLIVLVSINLPDKEYIDFNITNSFSFFFLRLEVHS